MIDAGEEWNAQEYQDRIAMLERERDELREALKQIEAQDYEPIEDSFTLAAAAIARAALEAKP